MAVLMANSRRDLEIQQFPWPIMLAAPLLAVFLQAYLPLRFPRLDIFDLPLLVVIYFAVSRRSPIAGSITGAIVGLLQDGVTHRPIGIHGIANTIIGFLAASIGMKVDVDNPITRMLMIFTFTVLDRFLYLIIVRHLIAEPLAWSWLHQLLRAAVNVILGVVLFAVLDRTRLRD
ncbi:MAG: Rod shape-determining protein MreD [Acidobacteriaceae bacterium]|jgi:rod shape-determining protein MreD|nr:Rod shape-determining protein MreD [Acidobacteriaceae bacterium]